MKFLNEKYVVKKYVTPYKIWVLDNFINNEIIDEIIQQWPEEQDERWTTSHPQIYGRKNILEQGMKGINKIDNYPMICQKLMLYFHSENFNKIIESITNEKDLLEDKSMRWSGLREMLPDSHQLIHSDARRSPESGKVKNLTCLLYLNKNYSSKDEGELEIWDDDMKNLVIKIEPLCNRFVIFKNTDTSFHGVPSVKANRKSMTFSILKNTKSEGRMKALFVRRPEDEFEIEEMGKLRATIKDATSFKNLV